MAVTEFYPAHEDWAGSMNVRDNSDRFTVRFVAKTDNPDDGPDVIRSYITSTGTYLNYSAVGNETNAAPLVQIDPTRQSGFSTVWYVDLTYEFAVETEDLKDNEGKNTNDPTQARLEISISFVRESDLMNRAQYIRTSIEDVANEVLIDSGTDPDGWVRNKPKKVTDSANVPYNPKIRSDRYLMAIRIRERFRTWNTEWELLPDAVNDRQFDIRITDWDGQIHDYGTFAPVTLKCTQLNSREFLWNFPVDPQGRKRTYIDRVVEVVHKPEGWWTDLLDAGKNRRKSENDPKGNGEVIPIADLKDGMAGTGDITDESGKKVTDPVPLDGNGQPIKNWKEGGANPATLLRYLRYLDHEQINMQPLLFPV